MHVCDREHVLEQKGCGHVYYYSLSILFPAILLIAYCIKTRNSQSKESRIQNLTYGIYGTSVLPLVTPRPTSVKYAVLIQRLANLHSYL